jgi:hypothetical protein
LKIVWILIGVTKIMVLPFNISEKFAVRFFSKKDIYGLYKDLVMSITTSN